MIIIVCSCIQSPRIFSDLRDCALRSDLYSEYKIFTECVSLLSHRKYECQKKIGGSHLIIWMVVAVAADCNLASVGRQRYVVPESPSGGTIVGLVRTTFYEVSYPDSLSI